MNKFLAGSFLKTVLIFAVLITFSGCAISKKHMPFAPDYTTTDYSKSENWAALPTQKDSSDHIPADLLNKKQPYNIDVFYVHPTTFTRRDRSWNASLDDKKLNIKTDKTAIKFQASIFNLVGNVYAPRYRQAHLRSYFTKDTDSGKKALDLAYTDIKAAFQYYLDHFNNGRPFILVSHSQGTTHTQYLIKDFIDHKPLQKKLIAAYLVGLPVLKNNFATVKPCESPDETGCFCSWRTYKDGFEPSIQNLSEKISVVNPVTWTQGLGKSGLKDHKGSILRNFDKVNAASQTAEIYKGVILTNKPKFPFSFLITTKNFHPGDLNLFYLDVQENARLRTQSYLDKNSKN